MSRRLPLVGSPARAAEAPVFPARDSRPSIDTLWIAVSDANDGPHGRAFAEMLAKELAEFGRGELRVDLPSTLHLDWLVTTEPRLPGNFTPTLHILVTHGRPMTSWSPIARALRDRVDVFLSEPGKTFASELARELVHGHKRPPT